MKNRCGDSPSAKKQTRLDSASHFVSTGRVGHRRRRRFRGNRSPGHPPWWICRTGFGTDGMLPILTTMSSQLAVADRRLFCTWRRPGTRYLGQHVRKSPDCAQEPRGKRRDQRQFRCSHRFDPSRRQTLCHVPPEPRIAVYRPKGHASITEPDDAGANDIGGEQP